MTNPTIREQCARALLKNVGLPSDNWEHFLPFVDAVLDTLMEPSEGMCMVHAAKPWDDWTVYQLWQAILDHVRKGGA